MPAELVTRAIGLAQALLKKEVASCFRVDIVVRKRQIHTTWWLLAPENRTWSTRSNPSDDF
jgi:hypothetical protein